MKMLVEVLFTQAENRCLRYINEPDGDVTLATHFFFEHTLLLSTWS